MRRGLSNQILIGQLVTEKKHKKKTKLHWNWWSHAVHDRQIHVVINTVHVVIMWDRKSKLGIISRGLRITQKSDLQTLQANVHLSFIDLKFGLSFET